MQVVLYSPTELITLLLIQVPMLVLEERKSEQAERTALGRRVDMLKETVQSFKRDLTTEAAGQPVRTRTHVNPAFVWFL